VELLVVITIIGMLMALLIPAVGAARARARQGQCLNNMTNLAKGVIAYETSKGRYPGYVQPVQRGPDPNQGGAKSYVVLNNPAMSGGTFEGLPYNQNNERQIKNSSRISWATVILPDIDNQTQWDIIVDPAVSANGLAAQTVVQPIPLYICPDDNDVLSSPENAGLSYSGNAGAWDRDQSQKFLNSVLQPNDPNVGDTAENGLFHNLTEGRATARASNIRDGASTTLLLAENVHKNAGYNWLGVQGNRGGEQHFGFVWVVNPQPTGASPSSITDQARFSYEPTGADPTAPDSDQSPFYARPASSHPAGSFNIMFADGHGRGIAPEIDYIVYQQLMTPNGRKCVDPRDHANPPEPQAMQAFLGAPPVSEKDLE
jgi:prepilin-type processing-associated H-X9-DG protein